MAFVISGRDPHPVTGWSFVVVKATEGATYKNPYFVGDVAAAKAAGFGVDAYHWVSPTSTAAAQVANVLAVLKSAGFAPGARVWLDFEQTGADIISRTAHLIFDLPFFIIFRLLHLIRW